MRQDRDEDMRGLLASIVYTSVDGIVGLDLDGSVLVWNQGAERMYGWSEAQMLGSSIKRIVPESLQGEIDFLISQVARGDEVRDLLTRRRRRDGKVIDISLSASPIRSAGGAIVGIVKTERDVTERRRQEAISEGQRHMLEALTRTGKLSDGLQALLQALTSLTEVRATSVVRRLDPEREVLVLAAAHLKLEVRRLFRRAIPVAASGHPAGRAARAAAPVSEPDLTKADGWDASAPLEAGLRSLHTVPIIAVSGEVLGTLDLYGHEAGELPPEDRDVMTAFARTAALAMDRFRVLHELQERRVFLEAVNRLNAILATQLEVQGILESVCEAATKLLGAHVGAFYYDPVRGGPEDGYATCTVSGERPALLEAFGSNGRDRLLASAREKAAIVRFKNVQQRTRLVPPEDAASPQDEALRSVVLVPMSTRPRGHIGVLLLGHAEPGRFGPWHEEVLTAIGSQTALALENAQLFEETRERARAMAEADRHKNRFLAALGHELRNPLSAIRASYEVLAEHLPQQDEVRDVGAVLKNQVAHMGRLVDDLLDLGRIMRGQVPMHAQTADLRASVRQAVESARTYAAATNVRIEIHACEEPLWTHIDETRVEQIVGNLLHNAVKVAPDSTVRVEVHAKDGFHVVAVEDRGIGIDPARQDDIFRLFSQVRGTEREGLGIGLALVQHLVSMHGGHVEVQSEGQGRGARFEVRLPPSRATEAKVVRAAPEQEEVDAMPLRVLLVEDDDDAAFAMSVMLERWGHELKHAATGATADALTAAWSPDVAVLDLGLPDTDGWAVAGLLRERFGDSLRIAALSGRGHDEDRERSERAGIDVHFVKPVDPPQLRTWIEGR